MEFKTQRELLEYLKKNPNDRKLVSRMICRGEVVKEAWWYVLVNKDRKIDELEQKLEAYDRLLDEFNKVAKDNSRLIKEKNDLIRQLSEKENRSNDRDTINKVYRYLTQILHMNIDKSDFIEWIEWNN